jgi:hypothetical protein
VAIDVHATVMRARLHLMCSKPLSRANGATPVADALGASRLEQERCRAVLNREIKKWQKENAGGKVPARLARDWDVCPPPQTAGWQYGPLLRSEWDEDSGEYLEDWNATEAD